MAKPKLALIPSAQGSKFYSVLPSSGVGDFDFTRSGGATRINSQGLIETVADGVSRLNYPMIDGKVVGCPSHLLEPSRTQLIRYSEAFDNAYWTKIGSSVVSGFTSPKGDLSAFKLVEDSTTSIHYIVSSQISIANATSYSMSCIVKANGRNWVKMTSWSGHSLFYDLANVATGTATVGATGTIKPLADGFYRLTMSYTSAATVEKIFIYSADADNSTNYTGDGTSGLYIWGAMLEQGSFPTSYIPTNGSAVTRSAETASNSGDASTFNDSEGVLMAEISALANDLTNRGITISDGSVNNRVTMFYTNVSNSIQVKVVVGGSNSLNSYIVIPNISLHNKFALKYKQNDFSLFVNGFELITDTSGNTFSNGTLTKLAFDRGDAAEDFYGSTKQIQYFDSALNDSDLEKLTSWVSFSDMANGQLYTIE